jgi:translation initiation factor 3 subunit H
VLGYEAHKALQGNLGVSAYRLTNNFYALYRNKKFTTSELKQLNISPSSIVERIPVTLRVNPLQRVLFQSINLQLPSSSVLGDPERFLLAEHDQPSLERASASVVEVIDDWQQDQNQWMYWWRGAQREQSRYAQALNKKRMENSSRIAQGLAGWTDEEIVANLDAPRIPTEPSRLDVLLVEASLFSHCSELERVANDAIIKAYTAKAFQQ